MVLAWRAGKLAQKFGRNVLVQAAHCSLAQYRIGIVGCGKEGDRKQLSFLSRGLYVWRSVEWLIVQACGTVKEGRRQEMEAVALHEAAVCILDPIPTVTPQDWTSIAAQWGAWPLRI